MSKPEKTAWVVSLTPFDDRGALDEPALRKHLARLCEGGQSVYAGSTNIGEGFSLDPDELVQVLTTSVDVLQGKTGVRAGGREARSIDEAVRMVRIAEAAKVDAVHLFQLDTGHGSLKPDVFELERFYTAVLEKCALPVVVSNYPSLGYTVPIDVFDRLVHRFPQIIAIRDSSGDLRYFSELVLRLGGRVELYSVGIRSILTTLFLGADGFLTVEGNIAPKLASSVAAHFEQGNFSEMRQAFTRLAALHQLLMRHGGASARGLKPLLNLLELPGGELRSPRLPVSLEESHTLFDALLSLDLPEVRPARPA
ncbi:dihydrodipicolinate synthase family protein [Phyllobacterium sophorae]|uniref:Dihydrodipicolinate synthase family protein n=1 Tax=Phyllobacterium sophorae TaxID=1520277 RepID=A0A2P7B6M4_9HYPH|nr:dihydrodipicolinate synthase family protein [Phyllobacterium sophorae]PSH62106.1 hypothetical protein CU103_19860 [Phyllobacterium sophorae]